MATESAVRIVETTAGGKWGSVKDPTSFVSHNLVEDELGLLLKGHKTFEDHRNIIPNRSGSAPPSMEGSYASFGNLLYMHTSSWDSALASSSSGLPYYQSKGRLGPDSPDYITSSNISMSAANPQPILSRDSKQQLHYMGAMGSNWSSKTSGGSIDGSLLLTRSSLSTHHEEPEDDISPHRASQDLTDNSPSIMSLQDISSLADQNRTFSELKQADFPRTASPAYNQDQSSSHVTDDEPLDSETETLGLDTLSLNITKSPDPESGSDSGARVENLYRLKAISNASAVRVSKTEYLDNLGHMTSPQEDATEDDNKSARKGAVLGSLETRSLDGNTQENKIYEMNSLYQQQLHYSHQHFQVQGYQDQVTGQSGNFLSGSGKVLQGPPNFSLQTSGFTPPLYATAAAYMASGNQYFSNLNPPPMYAPQYGMGGYTLGSTFVPPFHAGYPSHAGLPIGFDPSSSQSFKTQTAVVSMAETNAQVSDPPHYNKIYGHQGLVVHPSFPDALQMQYFQYPPENSFSPSHYGSMPQADFLGNQFGPFAPQRDPNMPYLSDKKFQPSPSASHSILSPIKVGTPYNNLYGTATTVGYVPQYPGSPLGGPLMPGSPIEPNPLGRGYDPRLTPGTVRNAGVYASWQGQRGSDSYSDSKKHSFLEEMKGSNARKINLSDVAGRIVELCVDQHGSRFIQQKLENCSIEEKESVFEEVLPHAAKLMTDVFGNYVIQKFFEHGDPEQRKELANKLSGQMLPLSLQMYGCRVIQKALEVIELDQKIELVHELDGHVMRCVRDQNGNHVIQKCIECVPTKRIGFIISAFQGQVSTLSTHPYGCRVIQRVLEHCSDDLETQCLVDEILEASFVLAQDQYGNYVTQHVLERGKPHERKKIISKLQGKIVQMSQHKYASNVVEKCLEYGDAAERETLIDEILAQPEDNDNLLAMMKDQFANYVVQKIIEISNDKQQELLLNRIRVHMHALKKYTYGKHIVARFEQLSGEEESGTSGQ